MNNPEIAKERLEKKNDPVICGTFSSALGRTRTCGLLIRSQTLFPAELRAHLQRYDIAGTTNAQGVG